MPKVLRDVVVHPLYTLEQAARFICRPCVYGLYDGTILFYVGKTTQPARRFGLDYQRGRNRITNPFLLRRINKAADRLRVRVLVDNPPNLAKAEKLTIFNNAHYLDGQIANEVHNHYNDFRCRICERPVYTHPRFSRDRLCINCIQKLRH